MPPSNQIRSLQHATFDGVVSAPGPGYTSGGLWGSADGLLAAVATNPENYIYFRDDFFQFDADDDWVVTNATAGTADLIDGAGGWLEVDSASTTADQGAQVQLKIEPFELEADKDLWFEARVRVTDSIDNCQFFVGLSVLDTTAIASGAISAADYIGFYQGAAEIAAGAGNVRLQANSGGTAVAGSDIAVTDGTFINLGFKVTGVTSAQAYVNGVATGDPISLTGTDNLPTGLMSPTFVCQTEGTTDPVMVVDWVKILKER